MLPLATAAQMKELDRRAIEERGIPSLELMDRAAQGLAVQAGSWWSRNALGTLPLPSPLCLPGPNQMQNPPPKKNGR